MSVSKPPDEVISDCIDATSHQILQLGDNGKSLSDMALVLENYMELLDRTNEKDDSDEANRDPVLKQSHISNRLLMAKMVVNLCLRPAYPDSETTFTPLIHLSETQWRELVGELDYLGEVMQNEDKVARQINLLHDAYLSLKCRMESIEALARLKRELSTFLDNAGNGDSPEGFIAAYKRTAEANREILESIHGSIYNNFFVPTKDLPCLINADSLSSLSSKIDDMMTKEVIPLSEMQVDFSKLVKDCNACLPLPKFVEVGYFQESNSFSEKVNISPHTEGETAKPASTPVSLVVRANSLRKSTGSDAGNHESPSNVKKPRGKRRRGRKANDNDDEELHSESVRPPPKEEAPNPRKRGKNELDFDSDTETKTSISSSSKRKKRLPYTDEEKAALMEGVKKYGVGSWKEILECYDDVFKQNKRTNVNLKDLYRTLTRRE